MWQADSLANYVADNHKEINIQKIYLDNYIQESTPGGPRSEQAQNAINSKIDKGVLLVNYTGHGGPLDDPERILELDQIKLEYTQITAIHTQHVSFHILIILKNNLSNKFYLILMEE